MKLNLQNQNAFLEMTKAPLGYELEYCIGTTYSLHIECLIQLAIGARRGGLNASQVNRQEALEILRKFRERSVVFCQACRIKEFKSEDKAQLSAEFRNLYTILDDVIQAVPAPAKRGSFHPKVWLLRFDSPSGEPTLFKLIVASRNLTMDMNWDMMTILHGSYQSGASKNEKLSQFFSLLSEEVNTGKRAKKILDRALADLPKIHFADPFESNNLNFDFQWAGKKSFECFNFGEYERLIVLSPFLSSSMVKKVSKGCKDFYLVTSEENLAELKHSKDLLPQSYLMNSEKMGLHAKVYIGQRSKSSPTELVIGSPNLSENGLGGGSMEAAIAMKAPHSFFDEFVQNFIFAGKRSAGLAGWLTQIDETMLDETPSESEEINQAFDRIKSLVAQGRFRLQYDRKSYRVSISYDCPTDIQLPAGYALSVKMFGFNEAFDFADLLAEKSITFKCPIADVSFFLCLRVSKGNRADEFWTVAEGQLDRRSRNAELTRQCIQNWDQFMLYLNSLLDLHVESEGFQRDLEDGTDDGKAKRKSHKSVSLRPDVLERLLLTVSMNEEQISKVDEALTGLFKEKVPSHIDREQFEQFWRQYKKAVTYLKRAG